MAPALVPFPFPVFLLDEEILGESGEAFTTIDGSNGGWKL
jgi:hypothetical protein